MAIYNCSFFIIMSYLHHFKLVVHGNHFSHIKDFTLDYYDEFV